MSFLRKDAQLKVTRALPNGAAAVNSPGLDLGEVAANAALLADVELLITAPAVTVGMLANTKTLTYDVQHDSDPAFGTPVTINKACLVQTGAGGAGAAAATVNVPLPVDCKRYVRVVCTNNDAGDASSVSLTAEIVG